ncbi:MAG: hypothetical protein LH478_03425 [Chitinophagaceae bacterium]|nr:hypothetical protein [Chitinophagaceae bacterium]
MQVHITDGWLVFCITFGIMLFATFIMGRLSRHFYTQDAVLRRFSIMDLEWPGSALELENLIKGLYKLKDKRSATAIGAVKKHLYADFLFMPAAYGSIFLLCMKISWKMDYFGPEFFALLAWLQIIPFLLDIYENIYLLQKIRPDFEKTSDATFKRMQRIEIVKWGIPLFSLIVALSAVLYFWVNGMYEKGSLVFVAIVIGEVLLFLLAGKMAAKLIKSASDHE